MRRLTSQKMTENRGLVAHPTPPVGVTIHHHVCGPAAAMSAQPSRGLGQRARICAVALALFIVEAGEDAGVAAQLQRDEVGAQIGKLCCDQRADRLFIVAKPAQFLRGKGDGRAVENILLAVARRPFRCDGGSGQRGDP